MFQRAMNQWDIGREHLGQSGSFAFEKDWMFKGSSSDMAMCFERS